MKKTLRSQFFLALAMLVIAVIALTSASFAWFTAVANPDVTGIDLTVGAANNVMLSAYNNATEPDVNAVAAWKETISKTDIEAQQTGVFPTKLFNVSSLFNASNSAFYKAMFSNLGAITAYESAATTDYVKFSLWAKSTNDGDLCLDSGSLVTEKSGSTPIGAFIKSTVRIGIVPVNDSVENWTGAIIWEPNSMTHLGTANGGPGGTAKLTTKAVNGIVFGTNDTTSQTTFDFQENDTNVTDDATKISLFNLPKDDPTNFNVYIWVEGADADTVNAVAKNAFDTYLKFGQIVTTP